MGRARTATATTILTLAGGLLLGSTGAAFAADDAFLVTQDSGSSGSCTTYANGTLSDRMNDGGTSVDGGTATLRGIPSDACDFTLSFTSYELPGGELEPFSEQRVFRNETYTVGSGDNGSTVTVGTPDCAWQIDLYLGGVNDSPPHESANLIAFDTNTAGDDGAEPCGDGDDDTADSGATNDDDTDVESGGAENTDETANAGATNDGGNGGSAGDGPQLARTGVEAPEVAMIAMWLLGAGGLVLWDARRQDLVTD